jgi:mRNA interferase MazF
MSLRKGDIVLITFPWTDLTSSKVRPALVISDNSFNKQNQDAIFVLITSKKYIGRFDLYVDTKDESFRGTGLKISSTFRMSKIMTLEQGLAKRRLGHASEKLLGKIQNSLKVLFNL